MAKLKHINTIVVISSLVAEPENKKKLAMKRTDIKFTIMALKRKKIELKKPIAPFLLLANVILILIHTAMNKVSTEIVIIFNQISTLSISFFRYGIATVS